MLGPGIFGLATVTSVVVSATALKGATDRGFALCAAALTGLEALLLAVLVLSAVGGLS